MGPHQILLWGRRPPGRRFQEALPDQPTNALTPCAVTLLPLLYSQRLLEAGTGRRAAPTSVWGTGKRSLEEARPREQENRKAGTQQEEATWDPGSGALGWRHPQGQLSCRLTSPKEAPEGWVGGQFQSSEAQLPGTEASDE